MYKQSWRAWKTQTAKLSALRTWLHGPDVGLAKEGADKVAAAKVLAAWEAANERSKTLRTKQAEERSAGLPAIIPGGAFIAMRRAWEEQVAANLHPGQTPKPLELPSKSFLEWRYTQVEGEFLTESLAEVTSQQEEAQQADDTTTADVIQQGRKIREGQGEVSNASDDRATPSQVPAASSALGYALRQVPEQSLGSAVPPEPVQRPRGLATRRRSCRAKSGSV